MFYIESNKGVFDIVTNYYLDFAYNDLTSCCTLSNIPQEYLTRSAKFVSGIMKTSNPITLKSKSLATGNWLTSVTMQDIKTIQADIPFYKSDKLRSDYMKDINRIIKKYPDQLVKSANNKRRKNEMVYKNNRDSILFLSDIVALDQELELVSKTKVLDRKEIQDLYSMTIRLILPRYLADKINCVNKEVTSRDTFGKSVHLYGFKEDTKKKYQNISEFTDIIHKHKDIDDLMPIAAMCKVYINVTLRELSDIINSCSKYEEDYIPQVIGAIYYNLYRFVNIREYLEINPDVESGIVERIHKRRSN